MANELFHYSLPQGEQERATRRLIDSMGDNATSTPQTAFITTTMINIARNFDVLSAKGRDTSRVMAQLLAWLQELESQAPKSSGIDSGILDLMKESMRK